MSFESNFPNFPIPPYRGMEGNFPNCFRSNNPTALR